MNIQNYGKAAGSRNKKLRRRLFGLAAAAVIILAGAFVIGKLTEDSAEYQLRASLVEENRILREQNSELREQIDQLQKTISQKDAYIDSMPSAAPAAEEATEEVTEVPTETAAGTTPRTQ